MENKHQGSLEEVKNEKDIKTNTKDINRGLQMDRRRYPKKKPSKRRKKKSFWDKFFG